jgi:hypothetical protein
MLECHNTDFGAGGNIAAYTRSSVATAAARCQREEGEVWTSIPVQNRHDEAIFACITARMGGACQQWSPADTKAGSHLL